MLNWAIYVRGHSKDYDEWASLGNKGWSYKDVLPYFKKSENFQVLLSQNVMWIVVTKTFFLLFSTREMWRIRKSTMALVADKELSLIPLCVEPMMSIGMP